MAGCYVERRVIPKNATLSWDIAHHLYTRQLQGVAIIVAKKPESLLSAITKKWYQLIRYIERERSSTLNTTRIMELTYEVSAMQRTRFTAASAEKPITADTAEVVLTTIEYAHSLLETCHTVYVTYPLSTEQLTALEHAMPAQSLIVVYDP